MSCRFYKTHVPLSRGLLLLHQLDLSADDSGRLMQSERPLEMVCRKRHQLLGHCRLSTRLGESDAPFGYLSVVFGSEHSQRMTAVIGPLNQNHGRQFKFDYRQYVGAYLPAGFIAPCSPSHCPIRTFATSTKLG
jgi:hypothetical protein